MFLRINKATDIDKYVNLFYAAYRVKIMQLVSKIISSENIYGKSDKQYILNQFFYVLTLISLLYNEFKRGLNTDWNYYIEKYQLTSIRRKIACFGIDLDYILSIFDLPNIAIVTKGIGIVSIEVNHIVEDVIEDTVETEIELFDIYLPLVDECVLNIDNVCRCINANAQPLLTSQDDIILTDNNSLLSKEADATLSTCQNYCY